MTETPVRALPTSATVQRASITQERLIRMRHADRGVPTQTVGCHLLLDGPVDTGRLRDAFLGVVRRHAILRTNYAQTVEGDVVAIVHDTPGPGTFRVEPATGLTDRAAIRAHATALFQGSLVDFASPDRHAMLQAVLVPHGEDRHSLLVTIDHIAIDERSKTIVQRELALLYADPGAHLLPAPAYDPAAVRSQYPPVGDVPELTELLDPLPPRILPSPDPVTDPHAFDVLVESTTLGAEASDAVGRTARRLRCTRFVLHLTALLTALKQFTGEADVSLVAAVDTRTRPEDFETVGFYQNLAFLRSRTPLNAGLRAIFDDCRAAALGALLMRDYPIASLVALAGADDGRALFRNPLYQVAFAYATENVDAGWQLEGVRVTTVPLEAPEAAGELLVTVTDGPDAVVAELEAARGALGSADMALLLGYWQDALDQLARL